MRRIVTFLRNQGIKVWVDNEKLVPGTPIWEAEIEKAIKTANAVIVILSPDLKASVWVRREISYAERYNKRIFPVLVRGDENSSITLRLITSQYVDIRENEGAGLGYLCVTLIAYLEELEARERKVKRLAKKAAEERLAREKLEAKQRAEADRQAKIEAERLATQKAEEERLARERAEAERKAQAKLGAIEKDTNERLLDKSLEKQNRILEAAIENKITVGKSAQLFVFIRRLESKGIVSVIKFDVDEEVILDEENVKSKEFQVEFPIEKGGIASANLILRLTSQEFYPRQQQKNIFVPPDGDFEIVTFMVTPLIAGHLILQLEVLVKDVSLTSKTIRTTAIETKVSKNAVALFSIPMVVYAENPNLKKNEPKENITVLVNGNVQGNLIVGDHNQILEAERQARLEAERLAAQKAEQDRLAREKLEAERKAKEETERLAAQKVEEQRLAREKLEAEQKAEIERKAKIKAERLAAQKAEEERLAREKLEAKQKAEQERLAREKLEAERQAKIRAERLAAQNADAERKARERVAQEKARRIGIIFALFFVGVILLVGLLFLLGQNITPGMPARSRQGNLYFTSDHDGTTQVYILNTKGQILRMMSTDWKGNSWSPAPDGLGNLYFTSDHDGTTQVYILNTKGQILRMMSTDWKGNSWSPAPDGLGNLYFTSDHDGTTQVYILNTKGQILRMMSTDWKGNSWSPAPDGLGNLYFTSDHDGTTQVYILNTKGQILRMMSTDWKGNSWSPAPDGLGNLYFTSDHDGTTQVYILNTKGQILRMMSTDWKGNSWSPAPDGLGNLYFTSDHDGTTQVYILNTKGQILRMMSTDWKGNSWLGTIDKQNLGH